MGSGGSKEASAEETAEVKSKVEQKGGQKLTLAEGEDFTIKEDRKCTDLLCCLIFIVFWAGMVVIGVVAFATGEPARLHSGYDFTGEVCGFGVNSEKPYVYYPYPLGEDGSYVEPDLSWSACVTDCPQQISGFSVGADVSFPNLCARRFIVNSTVTGTQDITCGGEADGRTDLSQFPDPLTRYSDFTKICVEQMPVCSPCGTSRCCDGNNQLDTATESVNKTAYPSLTFGGIPVGHKYGFCFIPYPSAEAFSSRCMPWVDEVGEAGLDAAYGGLNQSASGLNSTYLQDALTAVAGALSGPQDTFNYLMDEVNEHKWIIAAGAGIALLLALLYTTLLRFAALPVSMVVLFGLWVLLAGSTVILCVKAGLIDPEHLPVGTTEVTLPAGTTWGPAEANLELLIAAAVIVGAVFLVYTVLLFFLVPRVVLAVKVIGIATECLITCPTFLVFPIFQWIATVVLFVWWILVAVYLAGAGSWNEETRTYDWDDNVRRAMIFHFFGLLWGRAFILAVGNLVIAGATAEWFLASDKKALSLPLLTSSKRTMKYHLGTAAVGSFIIAVVQFIRWVFRYYMYQLKKMNPENKLVKLLSCLGECCLACLERFLNFINKNAYIQTSIMSTSFLFSAKNAFMLLLRNCLRIGTLTILANAFIMVGKYLIAVASAFLCALLIAGGDLGDITSAPIFSVVLICLLAFCVASAFMDVWEMVIDTIFQCYCMDEEYGTGKTTGKISSVVAENPPKENDLKAVGSAV